MTRSVFRAGLRLSNPLRIRWRRPHRPVGPASQPWPRSDFSDDDDDDIANANLSESRALESHYLKMPGFATRPVAISLAAREMPAKPDFRPGAHLSSLGLKMARVGGQWRRRGEIEPAEREIGR